MPSFALLDEDSPVKQQQQQQQPAAAASVPSASWDEPFAYLLHLSRKAAAAGKRACGQIQQPGRIWQSANPPQHCICLLLSWASIATSISRMRLMCVLPTGLPVSAAGPPDFPIKARIYANVNTFVGKLQFTDPQTGLPQVGGAGTSSSAAWRQVAALLACLRAWRCAVQCG
jgi:hypothetical protein